MGRGSVAAEDGATAQALRVENLFMLMTSMNEKLTNVVAKIKTLNLAISDESSKLTTLVKLSRSLFHWRHHCRRLLSFGQVLRTSCRQSRYRLRTAGQLSRPRNPAAILCRQRCLRRSRQLRQSAILERRNSPSSRQRGIDGPHLDIERTTNRRRQLYI